MLLGPSAYNIRSSPVSPRKKKTKTSAYISYAILSQRMATATSVGPSLRIDMIIRLVKRRATSWLWTFGPKIPKRFLHLHLILVPVNTHRDRQMDAGCCSSSTHPQENCNRSSKCCLQIPFFCMPLLYTPPTHKAMFHGWMERNGMELMDGWIPLLFYHPTTRVQQGIANTWKCAGQSANCWVSLLTKLDAWSTTAT